MTDIEIELLELASKLERSNKLNEKVTVKLSYKAARCLVKSMKKLEDLLISHADDNIPGIDASDEAYNIHILITYIDGTIQFNIKGRLKDSLYAAILSGIWSGDFERGGDCYDI